MNGEKSSLTTAVPYLAKRPQRRPQLLRGERCPEEEARGGERCPRRSIVRPPLAQVGTRWKQVGPYLTINSRWGLPNRVPTKEVKNKRSPLRKKAGLYPAADAAICALTTLASGTRDEILNGVCAHLNNENGWVQCSAMCALCLMDITRRNRVVSVVLACLNTQNEWLRFAAACTLSIWFAKGVCEGTLPASYVLVLLIEGSP